MQMLVTQTGIEAQPLPPQGDSINFLFFLLSLPASFSFPSPFCSHCPPLLAIPLLAVCPRNRPQGRGLTHCPHLSLLYRSLLRLAQPSMQP